MNPGPTIGTDVFRFAVGFGNDTITGFGATPSATVGQDRLNVSAIGGLSAASISPTGRIRIQASGAANTLIIIRNAANTADEGRITLNGVSPAAVTAADFSFVP